MSGCGGRKLTDDEAEVEALLRAAQDAVLLKIQANSHLVSSSSSAALNPLALDPAPGSLDEDLARRLDALKSRPPAPRRPDAASDPAAVGVDEMEARFAALKGVAAGPKDTKVRLEDLGDESEEDEVEKLMRWAMDAARLDVATAGGGVTPSAKENEEEDRSSASSEEEEEEDRLELEMAKKRKEKETVSKKNKTKNRWFFF